MDTTELLPGIYRIVVAGHDEPELLTRHGERGVTILPRGAAPELEQKWRIAPGKDGNIIIQLPSLIRPTHYLTYEGAPKEPEQGDRIVYRLSEFPRNEWHLAIAPGFRSLIRVAGSELGIRVAPPHIYPPFLELGFEHQLQWVFEHVDE